MTAAGAKRGLPQDQPLTMRQLATWEWQREHRDSKVPRHRIKAMRQKVLKLHAHVLRMYDETGDDERWDPDGVLLRDGANGVGSPKRARSLQVLRRYLGDHFGKATVAPPDAESLQSQVTGLKRELRAAQARLREIERVEDILIEAVTRAMGLADGSLPVRRKVPAEVHPTPWDEEPGASIHEVMAEEIARSGGPSRRRGAED